jgi:hypothetical protein
METLPEELNGTYNNVMGRIQSQDKVRSDLAMKVLMWLSYALRPLKLGEIQDALAVMELDLDERDIDRDDVYPEKLLVTICAGVVILENETAVIRFVHHTAEKILRV